MIDQHSVTQHREQLARVLNSPAFQSSKQTRDFLQYVCERVFSGATSIDQSEIARDVLGRPDFDPTTDASVRKLATSARQRLEKYYEGPGAGDEIGISLPLRSYAPQFELRSAAQRSAAGKPPRWRLVALAAAAVLVLAGTVAVLAVRTPIESSPGEIEIRTEIGDLTHPRPDAAPGALRLGPVLAAVDEIAAEVSFRPEHEGQHAGLILWEGPGRWVAAGRRFTSRNYLSLTYQYDAYPVSQEVLDIEGQSGRPVWLRLVRAGDLFRAYSSADAMTWTAIGSEVRVPLSTASRGGVFAFNGRRPSPSIPARFRLAGAGPALFGGETPPAGSHWSWESTCPAGANLHEGGPETAGWPRCHVFWRRPFSPTKPLLWSVTTRVDAPSTPGTSAGLFLEAGPDRRLRLVRYHGENPVLALIQDGRFLDPAPDYAGSPPVYLRLRAEEQDGGQLIAESSLDGVVFRRVGHPVPASVFGKVTAFGVTASKRSPPGSGPVPPLRFFFVRQDLFPLEPVRFDRRG